MNYFVIGAVVLVVAAVGYWWMFMRKDSGKTAENSDMSSAAQPTDMGGEKSSAPAGDSAPSEAAPTTEENTEQPTA